MSALPLIPANREIKSLRTSLQKIRRDFIMSYFNPALNIMNYENKAGAILKFEFKAFEHNSLVGLQEKQSSVAAQVRLFVIADNGPGHMTGHGDEILLRQKVEDDDGTSILADSLEYYDTLILCEQRLHLSLLHGFCNGRISKGFLQPLSVSLKLSEQLRFSI